MPEESLPTFNSHAIEMNVHRIEGLADHFLYMNDDTFIGRPLQPETFFKNGLPCINGAEIVIPLMCTGEAARHAAFNDVGVINAHFKKKEQVKKNRGKYIHPCYGLADNLKTMAARFAYPNFYLGFKNKHTISPFLKQTFEEIWRAEPKLLMDTSCSRFRSLANVNQWLALWWQVASGQFTPSMVDNVSRTVTEQTLDELCSIIREQKHDMFWMNDPNWEVDFVSLSGRLQEAFEAILPGKSSLEK